MTVSLDGFLFLLVVHGGLFNVAGTAGRTASAFSLLVGVHVLVVGLIQLVTVNVAVAALYTVWVVAAVTDRGAGANFYGILSIHL